MSAAIEAEPLAHDWWVFSTAIQEVVLILVCRKTGSMGIVRDPTADEWRQAFYAPGKSYRWHDPSRVEVMRR
jgi:hypothetical protein